MGFRFQSCYTQLQPSVFIAISQKILSLKPIDNIIWKPKNIRLQTK